MEPTKKTNTNNITPTKVNSRLNIQAANKTEQERFKQRISTNHKTLLNKIIKIFNETCNYPWYVIGSISFLINAKHSNKQPQDIDIIFNEEDQDAITKKLLNLNFKKTTAKNTDCIALTGTITNKNKTQKITLEAFAQNTENPNGIINPGAKNTKCDVIQLKQKGNKNFTIIGPTLQTELYFKSLVLEVERFNLTNTINKIENKKITIEADKFINRLINLFELNENNPQKTLKTLKEYAKTKKEKQTLQKFKEIIKEFKYDTKLKKETPENIQDEIAHLKKLIRIEIKKIIKSCELITKEKNKQKKTKIAQKKQQELQKLIEQYKKNLSHNKEDLPLYIFIKIFEENFIKQITQINTPNNSNKINK